MKLAKLYKKLAENQVQCLACSWYCRMAEGKTGICGTRINHQGKLYSLVYGRAIGLQLDPVEKKPLFHFLPGKYLLSFGTAGCNFGCKFCQNWTQSQGNKTQSVKRKTKNLIFYIENASTKITPKEIVELAVEKKAAGIAYTYNEPAIFIELAYDTAKLARKKGLRNVFVSNGFESEESFQYIKPYLDAINIDLKSFSDKFYRQICKAKIEPVKANIKKYFRSGIITEVTTLLIPGYNDSNEELQQIAQFLAGISKNIPWHISAFHPDYQMLDVPVTRHEDLLKAYKIGRQAGLNYVYLGNIADPEHSVTTCPQCQAVLVDRTDYQGVIKNLDKRGRCRQCREKIYGIWH
ncbi:AmmeMemoRadiSam system radical SAM enzyme [bacterium]|nr:AmmeMemoRadiSam system radical SAM enzyme [bacterium]